MVVEFLIPISTNFKKILSLKNISKIRFFSIFILSVISAIILTYQTIDYIIGISCCGENSPEIVKAFREYGTFLGVPISMFGILQMILTISLLIIISMTLFPKRYLVLLYYFLLSELLISCILVVNLVYIELVVIKSFCLPCSFSQITIFSSTLLVYFWNPFIDDSSPN